MTLKDFAYNSVFGLLRKEYDTVHKEVEEHRKKYKNDTAICYVLFALEAFFTNDLNVYYQMMDDASFLIERSQDEFSLFFYEVIQGYINWTENNCHLFEINYKNARKIAVRENFLEFFEKLNKILMCPSTFFFNNCDPLSSLVKIGQAVASEKNIDILVRTIAEETKVAMNSDRCTLFIYDKDKNELYSKVATGLDIKELRIPADRGIAGYVACTGDTINIKDAYKDERFNPDVDKQTGYKTTSILCMPIRNFKQEVIGVFQVINKLDGFFTQEDEDLLVSIAASTGISLENAKLFEEQRRLIEEQKIVLDSFIETLATSIDARDKITSGHSSRVKMYSVLIANKFEMTSREMYILVKAAILHDIGKIGIRDSVLQKEGKLTPEEYKHIQEHVEITHHILEKIHMSKEFQQITEIASSHHEKYDGSGYYRKLKGEMIPFSARILAVSDVFDAITSKRHYRDKMPIEKVIDIIKSGAGSHFDPDVVEKFLDINLNEIVNVFNTENNMTITSSDKKTLEKYNLLDLYYSIVNNCSNKLLQVFNKYYVGVDLEHE